MYRPDLALVHHLGFGAHADDCAPGILALLSPVRERDGLVLELGCGSGRLTRHLLDAGHRVIATDASAAMVDLAREAVPEAEIRRLALPDDPLPAADAIVSVGHVLNYLEDGAAIDRALAAIAEALRPDGIVAVDLCDLRYARVHGDRAPAVRITDDWAVVSRGSAPTPATYLREITVFIRESDGSWRRDDERHENVLVGTSHIPELLARHGVEAEIRPAYGEQVLLDGIVAVVGRKLA